LIEGKTPRLIDEWQEAPKLWNYIRHEVDNRQKTAQFILTGSANPADDVKLHSGAGRFTLAQMNTMSWQEMGYSTGKIGMSKLLQGEYIEVVDERLTVECIAGRMVKGCFPAGTGMSYKRADGVNVISLSSLGK
jgi:predicted AAA+ superfamily ATPase